MAENVFEQLKDICSSSSEVDLDDIPLLTTIDPFIDERSDQTMVIKKIKLFTSKQSTMSLFIRKVFIKSSDFLDYRYIGWILNDDILICMICSQEFTLFNRRHHCRLCGDIICEDCSNNLIQITEIFNYGPVRVCNCCYYGQAETSLKDMIDLLEQNSIHNNNNDLNTTTNNNNNNFKDDESIISRSDLSSLSTLVGLPGLVIKCRQTNSDKVFINICYHSLITSKTIILIGENCPRHIIGKGGDNCFVYDVCVSLESLEEENDAILDKLFLRIISVLNRRRQASLESSYIILRTKKNFKGDHIPLFLLRLSNGQVIHEHTILQLSSGIGEYSDGDMWEVNRYQQQQQQLQQQLQLEEQQQQQQLQQQLNQNNGDSNDVHRKRTISTEDSQPPPSLSPEDEQNLTSPPHLPSEQFSTLSEVSYPIINYNLECPPLFSGWMKRNEGTIITSFVKRFFVLDRCVLTCYEMSSDTPPYGRNQKGQFQLTSSTQIDLISTNSQPNNSSSSSSSSTFKFNMLKNKTNLFTNKGEGTTTDEKRKRISLTQTQLLLSDPFRKFQKNKFNSNNDMEEYFLEVGNVEDHTRWVQSLLHHIEYCTMTKRRNSLS